MYDKIKEDQEVDLCNKIEEIDLFDDYESPVKDEPQDNWIMLIMLGTIVFLYDVWYLQWFNGGRSPPFNICCSKWRTRMTLEPGLVGLSSRTVWEE